MTSNPRPPQQQSPPGRTGAMRPEPADEMTGYTGRGLLAGKVALVTGGDSGIGAAVCVAFAKEGAVSRWPTSARTPMPSTRRNWCTGRAADPDEIVPSYVFLAAQQLSSYYSGEVLAPIGGETHPG